MNKIFIILFTILFSNLSAKTEIPNLRGEWKGQRFQFDETKSKYIAEFEYTYTLTQEANQIKGISKITKGDASAEIAVRGFIQDNKFYFEEYEVLNAKRREGFLWCLKKGVLDIQQIDGKLSLTGATPSFMEIYGYECTGGVTFLSKNNEKLSDAKVNELSAGLGDEAKLNINVYPNPYIDNINLSFNLLKEEQVIIDVIDIQGKVVLTLENRLLEAGPQSYSFIPSPDEHQSYFYIRLKIGDKTISKAIQRVNLNGDLK